MSFSSPLGPLHFAAPSTSSSILSLFKSKPSKKPSAPKRSSKTGSNSQNHSVQISLDHGFASSAAPPPYHKLAASRGLQEDLYIDEETAAILAKQAREAELMKRDAIMAANLRAYGL